ncbi:MAG TPA: peptidylprolyl isomerase [Bryobacteraceae bacterium]|nr:peptidylprolyl isomerase [Bryobacteraceae bacterium]
MRFSFLLLGAVFAWGQQASQQTTPPPAPKPLSPALAPPQLLPAPTPVPSMVAPDTVVLTVGEDKITKAQFDMILSNLSPQQQAQVQTGKGRREVAEKLAEILTLAQEARLLKLDQTPKVQTQIMLSTDQLLANTMFRDIMENTKPDDAALHAYYDAHKADWEQVKARHILIRFQGSKMPLAEGKKDLTEAEALAKATELRAKIVAGADFATVAKEESDDKGSGANGGDLGAFGKGQMVPEFEKEAFQLPIGQVSQPVKSPFGYHLIKVESHGSKPFDEVKVNIQKQLPGELAQKTLSELKAKKPAVYNDAYFGK